MNIISDPVVQFFQPKLHCNICDREGHTSLSCDFAESKVGPNMSYADSVFWMFVDPCDRPEGFEWSIRLTVAVTFMVVMVGQLFNDNSSALSPENTDLYQHTLWKEIQYLTSVVHAGQNLWQV